LWYLSYVGVPWLIALGRGYRPCLYSASYKMQVFHFLLSLHHPNNHLENINIFVFPLNTIAIKTVLSWKKFWSGICPSLHPQVLPMILYIRLVRVWQQTTNRLPLSAVKPWFVVMYTHATKLFFLCSFSVNPSAWSDGHCPHATRSHSFVYISTSEGANVIRLLRACS